MGKALVIKDADFSENGIQLEPIKGRIVKTNTSSNGLNIGLSASWINELGLSNRDFTLILSSHDDTVNEKLNGLVIIVKAFISGAYTDVGSFLWGRKYTTTYPLANSPVELRFQSTGSLTDMNDKDVIVEVYQE
jgi:hypothetical protein